MKDSVDFCVLKHVLRNVHKDTGPELIVFVTGDGDFINFSTAAENRGKKTEFWSVDPSSTSMLIRQEQNFRQIEVSSSPEENPFTSALGKLRKGEELDEAEKRRLKLVSGIGDLNLAECSIEKMAILISERLGITYTESTQLLEMLVDLGIADVNLAINRVVQIGHHSVFQYLQSTLGSGENQNNQIDQDQSRAK